uniref:Uncharacterized protein n=1 Tax=Salix viminalis TaxID=40686 RepID=A0A6N2L0W2_SALVM
MVKVYGTIPRRWNQDFHAIAFPCSFVNFESLNSLLLLLPLSSTITPSSFDLAPPIISSIFSHSVTVISSKFTRCSFVNFESLNSLLLLLPLSSTITPSSFDLAPPIISSIFSHSVTVISSKFTSSCDNSVALCPSSSSSLEKDNSIRFAILFCNLQMLKSRDMVTQ